MTRELPKLDWLMPTWTALQDENLDFKNTMTPNDLKLLSELLGTAGAGSPSRR